MKTLAFAIMLFSIPVPRLAPREPVPTTRPAQARAETRGRWYMADNGHAVYCVGPVVTVTTKDGHLQRAATYCKGENLIVPLHD